MSREFEAVFENGLFRPLEPVDLPESEVVRILLVDKAAAIPVHDEPEGKSFYDALLEAGLLGCAEGGPPDLSTNPKYMAGFGESADTD